ncbi:hypothetical protein F53441_9507 [Fusarium austroafricanum]|uniref:Uncharacterized protein n=1 Tax=Fusarium austroafricanum TaxID=2364996 RepID=A0A8H4KBK1_9HYPO|nr:hypothetical protein F53441_9507 [Fusarium austroafricanum]
MSSPRSANKDDKGLLGSGAVPSPLFSFGEVEVDRAEMEKSFSKQNDVKVFARLKAQKSGVQDMVLKNENFQEFQQLWDKSAVLVCFINRFIMIPGISDVPKDKKRLRVSSSMFKSLLTTFDASPCFVSSMINREILVGLGSRLIAQQTKNNNKALSFWYTLPVRTASPCFDEEGTHALSVIGSNQMDPNGYLHLGDINHDIRPSKIGIYSWYDGRSCKIMIVDFQDGRLHEIANEPYSKTKEMIERSTNHASLDSHAVLLSSSAKWWSHALTQLKRQLIHCELQLLEENMQRLSSPVLDLASSARHLAMKKTLHSTMSHLQRYKIELERTEEIAADLQIVFRKLHQIKKTTPSGEEANSEMLIDENILTIAKHISALRAFLLELETKTTTIMELLSDVVKSRNDMLMVNNGSVVRKLLKSARKQSKASQTMMKESQKMASEMRKDSVSMKTIALLTMAFLPATSIAAILSMPFFSQQKWFNNPARVWLWVVLTVPATVLAVGVYLFLTRKEMGSNKQDRIIDEEDDMESVDFVLDDL